MKEQDQEKPEQEELKEEQQEQELKQEDQEKQDPKQEEPKQEQPKQEQLELIQQKVEQNDTNSKSNKNSKIIICIVLVIAMIGLVVVFKNNNEDAEEDSNYIVLEDKKEDFTIDLPKDWSYEVIESEEDQTYSVNCINQELESTISVLVTPKIDDITADDLVDLIGVYYLPFGFNPITRENVTINNADGVKYEITVGDKEIGEFYQMGFVTIGDEYNFSIIIQSAIGMMDQMKPTFEHVINSFELN